MAIGNLRCLRVLRIEFSMIREGQQTMGKAQLYPLRFDPIYQYRLWGGRRLSGLLSAPLPGDRPVGEAWVLSDRTDHQSVVANGPLKGQTLGQVMERFREQLMGKRSSRFSRFPLLLKFLDAHEMLSVQVHPSDAHPELIPAGDTAKTEAWVVIEAEKGSHIFTGLRPGTTASNLRQSLVDGTIADRLVSIAPKAGDAVFIPAGTVHTLGNDVVVFEVGFTIGVISIRRPRSLGRSKWIRPLPASSLERAIVAWSRPAWRLPNLLSARGSSIAMLSCCGDCSAKTYSPLEPRQSRAYWYALRAQAR
jgi:hypothetical protein